MVHRSRSPIRSSPEHNAIIYYHIIHILIITYLGIDKVEEGFAGHAKTVLGGLVEEVEGDEDLHVVEKLQERKTF